MPLSDEDLHKHTKAQLVVQAVEEASEVIQAACKAMRFGLDGHHPEDTKWETSNVHALCTEGEQLGAILRVLGAKAGISYSELVDTRHKAAAAQAEKWPRQ